MFHETNENETLDLIENEESGYNLACEFILIISQLLCFPFAIDANEEIITHTYKIIKEFNLFNKIISSCVLNVADLRCDIPISLIARLILTDEDLVQLMIDQLNNSTQVFNIYDISLNLHYGFLYFLGLSRKHL
jgi:hypothetical protein